MSEDKSVELGLQHAADNRKSEIALLWSRSLYFWGLITILLGAYGAAFQSGHRTLATLAGSFGVLCSLSWSLANRSSKYWQEVWEKKTEHWECLAVERGALVERLFNRDTNPIVDERWFWGAKQYSPSKLVMAISDLAVVGWLSLLLGTILWRLVQADVHLQRLAAILGTFVALALTFVGAYVLLCHCRSGGPFTFMCQPQGNARNVRDPDAGR